MKIAIVGGTGMLGSQVEKELHSRGHEVRILSRSSPEYRIDLITGEGLNRALQGCDVVIDASNATSNAEEVLVNGTLRLLAAEQEAGVGHHVCVSIVGCEKMPVGYLRAKAGQERAVEEGEVPWSIVRATQFHEYMAAMFAMLARWGILPIPRARVQTVAVAEVARAVAEAAVSAPSRARIEVAGPEVVDALDLARVWRSITGKRSLMFRLPLPGKFGRILRDGAMTSKHSDIRGKVRFADCLKAREN